MSVVWQTPAGVRLVDADWKTTALPFVASFGASLGASAGALVEVTSVRVVWLVDRSRM
jgi:hypothetical protein